MISFLIRAAIFLGSAAVGLLVASLILSGFSAPTSGFIVAVVIFAIAQSVLAPFIATVAKAPCTGISRRNRIGVDICRAVGGVALLQSVDLRCLDVDSGNRRRVAGNRRCDVGSSVVVRA